MVYIADIQKIEGDREGVAVLMKDLWHSAVIDFGCVSSRTIWVKFNFSSVKICIVVV